MSDTIQQALTAAKNEIAADIDQTLQALAKKEQTLETDVTALMAFIAQKKQTIETAYIEIENAIATFGQSAVDSSHGLSSAQSIITEKDAA